MELGNDSLDTHWLLGQRYVSLALLVAVNWLLKIVSWRSDHLFFSLTSTNGSLVELDKKIIDEVFSLRWSTILYEISHIFEKNSSFRNIVSIWILLKLLIEHLHSLDQAFVEQQFDSGWRKVKPRIIWIFIIAVVFVCWALPGVQAVGAQPLNSIRQNLIKQTCRTIYDQQVLALARGDVTNENHFFVLPSLKNIDHALRFDGIRKDLTAIQSNIGNVLLDIAALDL